MSSHSKLRSSYRIRVIKYIMKRITKRVKKNKNALKIAQTKKYILETYYPELMSIVSH